MTQQKLLLNTALIILVLMVTVVSPYRVLGLFPHPGISHFHFFHPIMKGLAEAGHNVDVVSHFPDKNPVKNYHDLPLVGISSLMNVVDLDVSINCR